MNLREIAKECSQISPLMVDRKKVSTDDILIKYGGVISLSSVDLVEFPKREGDTVENIAYYVVNFAEDPRVFYNAGIILSSILGRISAVFGGDLELNNSLKVEPLKIRLFRETKTTNGEVRSIINVEIL